MRFASFRTKMTADMKKAAKILIGDDDRELCESLTDVLAYFGFETAWVGNGKAALEAVADRSCRVVLLDLLLPGVDGLEVMRRILETDPTMIIIMMSGHGNIRNAIQATRLGAYDWLEKPFESERLLITVRNALEKWTLLREKTLLLEEARQRYRMVGTSEPMREIFRLIDKVAPTNSTVLISGESGTGKELVARAIHLNSRRASAPFIKVNCAAIPETLIESELFGHKKGAFTHAVSDRAGKFLQAHGGTLFLDEIGDLSPDAQAKVLRAVEYGEIETVGTDTTEIVDVRLIAATNKNLRSMMSEKRFREDLYHRINFINIHIPPLRKRVEDVLPLARHFLDVYSRENQLPSRMLTPDAIHVMQTYDWPGNVRELRHLMERVFVLVEPLKVTSQHLYDLLAGKRSLSRDEEEDPDYRQAVKAFEKSYITNQLISNGWNISQTARRMRVARSMLYKKMDEYGIRQMSSD